MKEISIKSTDIAKRAVEELPQADEKYLIFGKVFEEVYTECTWLRSKSMNITKEKFIKKLAAKLKEKGVDDQDLIRRGYRIFSCFLSEDIVGRKPKSQYRDFKEVVDGRKFFVRLYAQPDLIDMGTYYEFKTGPLNEYSRIQSQVFYWVIDEPIILVGVEEKDDGYINAQKETIDACDVDIKAQTINIIKDIHL